MSIHLGEWVYAPANIAKLILSFLLAGLAASTGRREERSASLATLERGHSLNRILTREWCVASQW